jgi:subtilisin family serine protease
VTTGVAIGAKIVSVRVLNSAGQGLWSNVAAGVDFAVSHVATTPRKVIHITPSGPASAVVQAAVDAAIAAGIVVVASAGNGNTVVPISGGGAAC